MCIVSSIAFQFKQGEQIACGVAFSASKVSRQCVGFLALQMIRQQSDSTEMTGGQVCAL